MSANQPQVPIYSQVLPKKDGHSRGARSTAAPQQVAGTGAGATAVVSPHSSRVFSSLRYDPRTPQPGVTDPNFDPLNHNHGGNFGGTANQNEAYSR